MADETPEQSNFRDWLSAARNSGCGFAAMVAGAASSHLFFDVLEFSPEVAAKAGDSTPDVYDSTMMMTKNRVNQITSPP